MHFLLLNFILYYIYWYTKYIIYDVYKYRPRGKTLASKFGTFIAYILNTEWPTNHKTETLGLRHKEILNARKYVVPQIWLEL